MREEDLHGYQNTAVNHIINNTHCALFLEMGLGKTVSTLTAIKRLMLDELDIVNALVIAPKRVAESVWSAECEKWEHLNGFKISKITGTESERRQALTRKADIYIIGRDNVSWLCGIYGGSMLPFDMLVIDELSSFKNPQSVRFKALRAVQPSFKRVVGLTGTPAPNGLIDLWSQLYLLDRGERLGKFIGNYRDNYFKPDKRNGAIVYKYKVSEENEKRIHDRISDICMSMKAEDYLQLPGRIDNIISIKFPKKLQQQYDEFEREQVLELFAGGEITVANAAALNNKLLQFANGAVYDGASNYHVVHDLKIEAMQELVENANGKPVLIAWTYRSDMERLKIALKAYNPKELKTDQDITDWNQGKIQVLMMHPASGGHGLNLQAGGSIIAWYGNTWSLELLQQLNARLDRQGKKEVTIIHKLVALNTMDEEVIASQESKELGQDRLMEAVKAKIKKYLSL
jgi:SNF2 family DNA or RNA helicase